MDNNVYPNNGAAFFTPSEPADQARQREEEISKTLDAVPLLKEIISHFDEQITFYSSVDAVPQEVLADEKAFMHVIAANKLTVMNLNAERDYILAEVDKATR
jgi:hypothetical protein